MLHPRVGPSADGSVLVPTGQRLRPAGRSLTFPGRPVDLALSRDGGTLYAKTNRGLLVIDARAWSLRQDLAFPSGGGSMHGLAVTSVGVPRVYATTAQNALFEARVADDGVVTWGRRIALPGPGGRGDSHACGLTLSRDEETAYVCLSRNNALAIVDLRSGRRVAQIRVGVAPFDVVLAPDGRMAYVSNWGGRHPRRGERSARSSGTSTLVDARGVAASGTVSVVDLLRHREVAQIATGLHPSDLELRRDGRRLYVANANSDTVSVIDTVSRRRVETVLVRPAPGLPYGSGANALALRPDGRVLFVANGDNNAVAVVAVRGSRQGGSRVVGLIPTGWYPGALATDGRRLYVANVKGLGSRHKPASQKGWHVYGHLGSVTVVDYPSTAELRRQTAQAHADGRVPAILRAVAPARRDRARRRAPSPVRRDRARRRTPSPVPERLGDPSVFEHVVYVIKENRTYDQLFGDLAQGNGDPELCIFGRDVTPNHHALAEQFVLLDNFYCNGVNSADGHAWVTEGHVTDHLEKSFGGFTRSYTFGDDPLTYSSSGFIWDGVLRRGLAFRNYGEMDYAEPLDKRATFTSIYQGLLGGTPFRFTQNIGIESLRRYSSRAYPGWNMKIPDVLRAEVFLKELREFEAKGQWPNFIILYLPNDHTSGTSPGQPTPRAQVADNDVALGRVVEGITRSKFWPKTCTFVIEDDPQDGFDHVDGHRSICLVISPYTRRGAVVSQFYNQTSVLHTMERVLGLPPMHQMDAMAPLMSACFRSTPNARPYGCLPSRVPLDELNPKLGELDPGARYWARLSEQMPWERCDQVDEDRLNRVLWHAVRGVDRAYPAHLAGAHGAGLRGLELRLTGDDDDE